jgi:glc operon protein GlcG
MPFSEPYGAPISAQRAQALIQTAMAEAKKEGMGGKHRRGRFGRQSCRLCAYGRARSSHPSRSRNTRRVPQRKYRRPTKVFEEAVQKSDARFVLSLDDVIASRGGIPLIEDGRIIGAIGCSGGTGSQDEVVCSAAAALVNKSGTVIVAFAARSPPL